MTPLRRPHIARYQGRWLCAAREHRINPNWRNICVGPIAFGNTLNEAFQKWQVVNLFEMPPAGSA